MPDYPEYDDLWCCVEGEKNNVHQVEDCIGKNG